MKKSLSILILAGAVAPFLAQAQSAVTVYGRIDLSVDGQMPAAGGHTTALVDNASRLGFRGTEDIGGGLKAAFGIEIGFGADTGTAGTPMLRNSYVGLIGDFGSIALGRLDSANPTGSPLYSQLTGNTSFAIHDSGAPAVGTKIFNARNRVPNAIGYMSPNFGGFNVRARLYQSDPTVSTCTRAVTTEGKCREFDLGLNYKNDRLGLGLGYGQDTRTDGRLANDFKNKWQFVGAYDFGVVKPYAVYGRDNYVADPKKRDNVDFWLLGARFPIGASQEIVANYMRRSVQSDKNGTLKKFDLSYSYKLSARTQLYALVDREDPNSNISNDERTIYSFGIQHNF